MKGILRMINDESLFRLTRSSFSPFRRFWHLYLKNTRIIEQLEEINNHLTFGENLKRNDRLGVAVYVLGVDGVCSGEVQFGVGYFYTVFWSVADHMEMRGIFVVIGLQARKTFPFQLSRIWC